MSKTKREQSAAAHQQAAEVLELGQMLFDAVIEVAARPKADDQESEPFPTEDVRAAADEFFRTLRVLLGLEDG